MLKIETLKDLRNYADLKGLEIHIEKVISGYDESEIFMGRKSYDDCKAIEALYGIKISKGTFLWFETNEYDFDNFDINNENNRISFKQFYNANNGAKQKGYRRYFNWCYKQEAL